MVNDRCCQLHQGKRRSIVACLWCGIRRGRPLISSICRSCIAHPFHAGRIVLLHYQVSLRVADVNSASILIQLECRVFPVERSAIKPYDTITMRWNGTHIRWGSPQLQVTRRIAEIKVIDSHAIIRRIVEFYPTIKVECRTNPLIHIRSHNLIDDERFLCSRIAGYPHHHVHHLIASVCGTRGDSHVALIHRRYHAIFVNRSNTLITTGPRKRLIGSVFRRDSSDKLISVTY